MATNPVQIIIQGTADFQEINEQFAKIGESSKGAFDIISKGFKSFAALEIVREGISLAKEFSDEWIRSAKSLAQLDAALRSTGQASEDYRQQLEEQRKAISAATGAEEDQLVVIQRHLVQYKASRTQIEELTKLSLDLAASQGMDGASAAMLLARSLGGQEVQLRGVRLEIDRTLPKYEQVNSMIRQLSAQVGGQARSAFLSAAPEITRFNNELIETKKTIGEIVTVFARVEAQQYLDMKHAAEAAFNTLVPARIQGQARGAWAWLTGNKPADNTNAPANDEAQRLHDQKMALLGLQTGAGLAAANLPGKAATLETVNAENEAFYTEGKRTLQDYLNVRGQLVIKEADLEFKVLFAALDSSNKELERKKKELDVVKGGTDLPQIEKTQQDYDKLLIENQKLRSELQAATEKRQQGLIGQQQLGFQNPTTLGGGVQKGWNDAVKDLGTVYTNLASTIKNTVGAAIDGVSKGITGLITGTETWGQALRNIGTSILNVVIDGLVRMFAAEVLGNQLVQASEEEKQAATIPGKLVEMLASAVSEGGWAAAALIAAAVAAVGIGVAAAAGAFAEGGRPPVGQVALVGERGPELFVPDTSGTIVPAHVTSDIMSGGNRSGRTGRAGRANGGNTTIHIHQWGDNKVEMDKYIRSMPGQHAVAEAVGKNQHIILKPS